MHLVFPPGKAFRGSFWDISLISMYYLHVKNPTGPSRKDMHDGRFSKTGDSLW